MPSGKLQSALRDLLCCSTSRTAQCVVGPAMDHNILLRLLLREREDEADHLLGKLKHMAMPADEERGSENLFSHIGASRFTLWGQRLQAKTTLLAIFCIIFCSTFFCVYLKVMLKDIWDREEGGGPRGLVCPNQKGVPLGVRCISAPSGRVLHEQCATT